MKVMEFCIVVLRIDSCTLVDCMNHNVICELSKNDGYDECLDVDPVFNVCCFDWEKFIYICVCMDCCGFDIECLL